MHSFQKWRTLRDQGNLKRCYRHSHFILSSISFSPVSESVLKHLILSLIQLAIEKVGDPKLMENLEQEISIMRDYLHPNIVQLFEHFSSSRYIYLVLELCPGGDLSKFIKKYHRVEEIIAQGFLRQLSDGLHFLQEKNVIHRDLKPANVLLSEFSNHATLKIADFGFAKHLVEASMAQTPCGSPL